jgi:hypothetical protein
MLRMKIHQPQLDLTGNVRFAGILGQRVTG